MNRRETLMALAAAAAGIPIAVIAQSSSKVWRIGFLGPTVDDAPHLLGAFRDGLREAGYVEGRNIVILYRWTTNRGVVLDANSMTASAQELIDQKVDVLAASIDPPIIAAKTVAGHTPIVMLNVSDPVALGLVSSLARPGGNITGLTRLSPELVGKNVQLLVELVPGARRIALLASTVSAMTPLMTRVTREAVAARGLEFHVVEVRGVAELGDAFAAARRARADAVFVPGDGLFFVHRAQLAETALAQRLPAAFSYTENVEAGGLLAYSPSSTENYRRAGGFIDKILRGANPGDVPIEQPTRFELAINLKTAKAMGIAVPQSLLVRADRVVE